MSSMTLSELRHGPRVGAEADFVSAEGFALMARMADVLANSGLVPEDYRAEIRDAGRMVKNPAAQANCMMALCAARRLNLDPFSVMHGLRVTDRGPKWTDCLMLTALERSGRFDAPQFELVREASDDAGETDGAEATAFPHGTDGDEAPDKAQTAALRESAAEEAENRPGRTPGGGTREASREASEDPDKTPGEKAGKGPEKASEAAGRLCCVMHATEKATGRTLEAGPVSLSWRKEERTGSREKAELALRRRALMLFCRLYAPDLFPGLPENDEEGDDAEKRALPRASADSRDGAPRARVTLEEIARQAKRSLEAAGTAAAKSSEAGPLAGKAASSKDTESAALKAAAGDDEAMPTAVHVGEHASPQNDAGADATPKDELPQEHAVRHGTAADTASDGTPTGGKETAMKKTRKEGTAAKAPRKQPEILNA